MPAAQWDLDAAGAPIVFPRRIRDGGLPKSLYRQRKWALRGRVLRWMVRTGYRQANRHYAWHGIPADALDAVGRLELQDAARQADRYGTLQPDPSGTWITLDDYELALCARTAVRIMRQRWSPAFIDTASLAGRVSRRGATYTADAYLDVQHMPQSAAARALGCSLSTIKRLARAAREAGSAIRAAALTHAKRARRAILTPDTWCQVTKTWGTSRSHRGSVDVPPLAKGPP